VPTPIPEGKRQRAITTIVAAFADDPVERWLFPDRDAYLTHFPNFVAALGGRAFEQGTAWSVEGLSAVALWLPPETEPDAEAIGTILSETVAAHKHDELFSVLEQMDERHPALSHWYLPWLGVRPDDQRRGLGSELLAQCLTLIDAEALPAYLETPNPRTIPLYRRHGFEVVGEVRAGSCPPLTLMLRPARRP
jgi:ribosomal protein S18 acetylase RimI-like enzyme